MQDIFRFTFGYDKRGYGYLVLFEKHRIKAQWYCRSGSCNWRGTLVNAIEQKTWFINSGPEVPAPQERHKMYIEDAPGRPWKIRLWPYPTYSGHDPISRYLIHPDGNKSGTAGCIGTQNSNAEDLLKFFDDFFLNNPTELIPVRVTSYKTQEVPLNKTLTTAYKPAITAKKTGTVTAASLIIATLIKKFLPQVAGVIEDAGLDSGVVITGLVVSGYTIAKDLLKHKFGIKLPF